MPLLGLAPFWVAVMLVAAASRFWEAIRAVLAETQELRERDCNCLTACFEGSHSYTALGSLCRRTSLALVPGYTMTHTVLSGLMSFALFSAYCRNIWIS